MNMNTITQEVINTHAHVLKQDLGITRPVSIVLSNEVITPDPSRIEVAHGFTTYTIHHNGLFTAITDISNLTITLYPKAIKQVWPLATKEELRIVMINTLAHELRHVQQLENTVGTMYTTSSVMQFVSFDAYVADSRERDAYQYADEYLNRLGYSTLSELRTRVRKRIGVVAVASYAVIGIGIGLMRRNKRK